MLVVVGELGNGGGEREFVTEEGIAGVGEGAGEVLGIDFVSGGEMGVASGGDGELAEAGIGGGD